jgi:hypothetical protein
MTLEKAGVFALSFVLAFCVVFLIVVYIRRRRYY